MRIPSSSVVAIALLGGISSAYAMEAAGIIQSLDASKDKITLDSGSTYSVPNTVNLSQFTVGEKVKVNYSNSHGQMDAKSIKPAVRAYN